MKPPTAVGWGQETNLQAAGGTPVTGTSRQRSKILHFFAKMTYFRLILKKSNAFNVILLGIFDQSILREGGRPKLLSYLTLKMKVIITPNLVCGLVFTKNF